MNIFGVFLFIGLCRAHESYLDIYVSEPFQFRAPVQPNGYNGSSEEHGFSLKTIYDGPLVVLTPTPQMYPLGPENGHLRVNAFFADKGLRRIGDAKNFQYLNDLLLSGRTSGLAYPGGSLNYLDILSSGVERIFNSESLRSLDILRAVQHKNIHILYVAPKEFFSRHHFVNLKPIATFMVSEYYVEPVYSEDPSLPISTTLPPIPAPMPNGGYSYSVNLGQPMYVDQILYRKYRQASPASSAEGNIEEEHTV